MSFWSVMKISTASLMIFSLLIIGCNGGDEPADPDFQFEYFGLQTGRYIVYEVDSSYFRQNVKYPVHFFLKSTVSKTFINAEGGLSYEISIQKRVNETDSWKPYGTHQARISNGMGIYTEGNVSYVKLLFPPATDLKWNGNMFNSLSGPEYCGSNSDTPCDIYQIKSQGKPITISPSVQFAEAVVVEQSNEIDNIVGDDVRIEVYARNFGLVQKTITLTEYCTVGCPANSKFITKGLTYRQVAISYGLE